MLKILYVHGIGSAGGGNTVNLFKKYFPNYEIDSPDIPEDPKEAVAFLREIANKYDVVIGTSLGGFYAMQLFGPMKILINPAIDAMNTVTTSIGYGEHPYLKRRKDGKKTYIVDDKFVTELTELYNNFFDNCFDEESMLETYALFGNEDEVCNCQNLFKKYYYEENMSVANFGHRMTEEVFVNEFTDMFNLVLEEIKVKV